VSSPQQTPFAKGQESFILWISDLLLCSDKHKILRAKVALVFLMKYVPFAKHAS
jgi:hypothetical protein